MKNIEICHTLQQLKRRNKMTRKFTEQETIRREKLNDFLSNGHELAES
jgi:hypothetical protein